MESDTTHLSSLHLTTLKKTEASYQSLMRNIEAHRATLTAASASKLGTQRAALEDDLKQHLLSQSHLEASLKLILDENDALDKTMDKQCKDLLVDENRLKTTENTLENEIMELRKQLEKKMNELEKNKTELASVRDKIDGVRSKFSKQTEKVGRRKEAAEVEKKIKRSRSEEGSVKAGSSEERGRRRERESEKLKVQTDSIEKKKAELFNEIDKLEAELKEREKITWICNRWKDRYAEESGQVRSLEEEKESVFNEVRRLETEIESGESDIKKLEEKLPVLEKDKKVASGARNFKEASRLASDIKEKQSEIEELQKKILSFKSHRATLQDSIPKLESQASRLKAKSLVVRKFFDISQYHKLAKRIDDLKDIDSFYSSHASHSNQLLAHNIRAEIEYSTNLQIAISTQYGDSVSTLPDPDQPVDDSSPKNLEPETNTGESTPAEIKVPKEESPQGHPSEDQEEEVSLDQLEEMLAALKKEYQACEELINTAAESEEFETADRLASENTERNNKMERLEAKIMKKKE